MGYNKYRPQYGQRPYQPRTNGFTSQRQIDWIRSMMSEVDSLAAAVVDPTIITAVVTTIGTIDVRLTPKVGQQGDTLWQEVPTSTASAAIDSLKAAITLLKAAAPAAAPDPDTAALPPHSRRMVTRFNGKCRSCGATTTAGVDWAIQTPTGWQAWCRPCAAGQAVVPAVDHRAEYRKAVKALFAAAGIEEQDRPVLRVAIPSEGQNDLDFLVFTGRNAYRTIGGRSDQPLAHEQAVTLVQRTLAHGVLTALAAYGRHLGRCGVCSRHLTDEASRAAGIGPVCASRIG